MEEVKAILDCLIEMGLILSEDFKDGIQTEDFLHILEKINKNEVLKEKLKFAYNNIDKVKGEVSDMTWVEGIELVAYVTPKLIATVKAIKA